MIYNFFMKEFLQSLLSPDGSGEWNGLSKKSEPAGAGGWSEANPKVGGQ